MSIAAHKTVADLCVAMAQDIYEELAKKNRWYAANHDRNAFIRECAPTLRAEARQILAGMLTDDSLSQRERDEIFEALMLDKVLPQEGAFRLPPTLRIPN